MSFDSNEFNRVESDENSLNDSASHCGIDIFMRAIRKYPPGYLKTYDVTTPQNVLDLYVDKLTRFEQEEIFEYPEIYYFGEQVVFKLKEFDNGDGFYQCAAFDHIAYRYQVWRILARTGFSLVLKAYDHKDKQFVAIKIIRNKRFLFYEPQNEIDILQFIKDQADDDCRSSFVQMLNHFTFRGFHCIILELMTTDLFDLMSPIRDKGFSLNLVQQITSALISSVYTLHRYKIVHCDLKPENIMLKNQGRSIKLTDFGLSCTFSNLNPNQTLHFCAPETLLAGKITPQIDMWSIGCIIAEMYTGVTLLKGEDRFDQMTLMLELLGTPPIPVLSKSRATKEFFYDNMVPKYCHCIEDGFGGTLVIPKRSLSGALRGLPASRSLITALKDCPDHLLIDLVTKCLDWNPATRITPDDAMRHSFMKRRSVHNPQIHVQSPVSSAHNTFVNSPGKLPQIKTTFSAPF